MNVPLISLHPSMPREAPPGAALRQSLESIPNGTPRFSNAGLLGTGLGANSGIMPLIQKTMSTIEADKIKELVISDVGAMVLPRTAIEWQQRGPVPARETLFREVTGTVTNTFMAGWLGLVAAMAFKTRNTNPKGMDFKAWIDSTNLEVFGNMVDEILGENKRLTPQQLQERFLTTALSRLKSSDNVPQQYAQYFKGKELHGMLRDEHVQFLVDRYMGRKTGGVYYNHQANNVEQLVAQRMNRPEVKEELIRATTAIQEQTLQNAPKGRLTPELMREMSQKIAEERGKLVQQQRKLATQEIRNAEGMFINRLHDYAVNKGKLTDQVFVLGKDGKPIGSMGPRSLPDTLRKVKFFMEEYLNRALYETGAVSQNTVNKVALRKSLFNRGGANWIQKSFVPSAADGLLSYAYKSKYFITLIPMLITLLAGCAMVLVNNWITRKNSGGKEFFPGEEALRNQLQGGGRR